jgi:ribosomal protein S12 methylthiotransferase accessory factor
MQSSDFLNSLSSYVTFRKVPFYNDEPKIYQYKAELQNNEESVSGHGTDILKEGALFKAVGEAVERTCLRNFKDLPKIYRTIADMPYPFVEPHRFQPFSAEQLDSKTFHHMQFSADSVFCWTAGLNVLTGEEVWIPAQLVFCPFDLSTEPVIRFPSSNGAALGYSMLEARCKAVLEVFERDAFMCWYFAEMPASFIDNEQLIQNGDLAKIHLMYVRYNLDLKIILLPSKWSFPIVLAVIIDETGIGPELRVGLKCHPHLPTAIKGAIFEAQQMRPWLRDYVQLYGLPQDLKKSNIVDSWSRALFWAVPNQSHQLKDLWSSVNIRGDVRNINLSLQEDVNWEEVWSLIETDIYKNGADLILFDLSGGIGKELNVSIVKAIIPQAHPVYMDEQYPYLSSENLISALNRFGPRWKLGKTNSLDLDFPPHPFS